MNNILIELYVPSINKTFDVYIPYTAKLGELESLLIDALKDVAMIHRSTKNPFILCDRFTGNTIDINRSAYELQLQNGSQLMLI